MTYATPIIATVQKPQDSTTSKLGKGIFEAGKKTYAKIVTGIAKPIVKTIAKATGRKDVKPMTSEEFLKSKVGQALSGAATITTGALAGTLALEHLGAVGVRATGKKIAITAAKAAKSLLPKTAAGGIKAAVLGLTGAGLSLIHI